jgi:ATP-dependent DNA helicase RecG
MNVHSLLMQRPGPMLAFVPEPDAERLAQCLVALANSAGGTIVLGADEWGTVYDDGVDELEPVIGRALQMLRPPLRIDDLPEVYTEETSGGRVTIIIVRPAAYQLSVDGRDVYVRVGATNLRLSPEQAASAAGAREPREFEDEVVPGATLDDLDDDVIDEYQRNRLRRGPRGEALTHTELLRESGAIDAVGRVTHVGLLLFGRQPHQFLPQVGVVVVRFRGTNMHETVANERRPFAAKERYARRVEVVGPAARLVERTWEVLFEEIAGEPVVHGLQRRESYAYPLEAVREAVVNAICHRDYRIVGRRIEIRLFDDHMEIMSPGGLPGHITLDNILDEHYSRNPRLVRGLYYWGYIEELGQGVDIIYEAMRREHHPPPEFRETGRALIVTLSNVVDDIELQYGEQFNPRQVRALRFLATNEQITNRDYQQLCPDVTPETLRLDLRDLVEKGILLKIGAKRGTYYVRK